jgi:hypothetical protein
MPVTPNNDPLGILSKTDNSDPLGILVPEKKNQVGKNLSVGQNGQLQTSVPATSNSEVQSPLPKSPEPNFGMSSFADLAKGQQNVSDNTGITTTPTVNTDNLGFQKAADKKLQQQNQKVRNDAIDNTVQRSLKLKGINAQQGSLLYNIEKSTYNQQLDDGNAVVGVKNGKPGLEKTTGLWDSFHNHMMSAINENKDSREFKDMTPKQRVDYADKVQQQQNSTEYIGEAPSTPLASIAATGGGVLPTLGLYGAGAMAGGVLESLAPETGGLSNLALKPVMSFVVNAGTEADKSGMQGTLGRYNSIIQQHPEIDKVEAMKQATNGEDVDRLAGMGQAALFSTTGSTLGKSVTKSFLKDALKTGVDVGAKTAVVEGAKDVGHNIEGVTNKSASDIFKDMGNTFAENAPMGVALHGIMGAITGISKVPNLIKSGLKYDVVTKMNPEDVQNELEKNVQSGAITPEQAEKAESDLNNYSKILQTVPASLSDESKASVTGLIEKRTNIEKEAATKDVTAQPIYKQQIDAINNQISDIQRTGKPLQHEIDESTGQTYQEPTFDDVAKQNVTDAADQISKGKSLDKPELIQAEANFPDELKKQLVKIQKQETPKEDETQSDTYKNVTKYLKANEVENKPTEITQPAPENKDIVDSGKKIDVERTPEEIKKLTREPLSEESIDKKVKVPDLENYNSGEKELPFKKVKAFEARGKLRQRLKDIENIIKCL